MAARMDSSETVRMSSTSRRMIAKFRTPSEVRSPSAMVSGASTGRIRPARSDRIASSARAGSAPNTRHPRFAPTSALPPSRPPPPTGTRNASTGPASGSHHGAGRGSSISSRAAVPWPAITWKLS